MAVPIYELSQEYNAREDEETGYGYKPKPTRDPPTDEKSQILAF